MYARRYVANQLWRQVYRYRHESIRKREKGPFKHRLTAGKYTNEAFPKTHKILGVFIQLVK
jgi:hypothetical protein